MEELTHFKKLAETNYFGEWDLPAANEGRLIVEIVKVETAEIIGNNKQKSIKPIVYFKGYSKPLVLNSTNGKAIKTALQTPYIQNWVGKKIELYRIKNLKAFGEVLDAVRVRAEAPKIQKPILNETHARFESAKQALIDKKTTIEDIQKIFELPQNIYELFKSL